jgi:hypothetical protein
MMFEQFLGHIQHNNIAALQQIDIEVDFIPAGYMTILQILDKGGQKPLNST